MRAAVALTTYNGEKYLEQMLESILNQKRQPDKVLISDDASSDNTVSVIKRFIHKNHLSSWELHENKVNCGWKNNFRNTVREICKRKWEIDYIFLADQDDVWHSDKIAVMMNVAKAGEIDLLACGYYAKYEDDTKHISGHIIKQMKNSGKVFRIKMNKKFMTVLRPGCAYMVSADFCRSVLPYWNGDVPHDAVLWRYAIIRQKAYIIDRNLFTFRRYVSSSSNPESIVFSDSERNAKYYNITIDGSRSDISYLREAIAYLKSDSGIHDEIKEIVHKCLKYRLKYHSALEKKRVMAMIMVGIFGGGDFYSIKTALKDCVLAAKIKGGK